jgi:predicted double-glycine peptidase
LVACGRVSPASGPLLPADSLPVPIVPQATNYSCGAAALLSILYYWQVSDDHEQALYAPLNTTPADGTEPRRIEAVARTYGLEAQYRVGMTLEELREAIGHKNTVIVDLQAWRDDKSREWKTDWDDGHYVVAVGIDSRYLYVMDPSTPAAYAWIPIQNLLDRWHDEEVKDGVPTKLEHMAIVIAGRKPLPAIPARLQPMD